MLLILQSAPCRLAPNEALPHTPLGALPLDPTSPLAPGLSVRFISCFARCFILLYACNLLWSAMLIPHSSLLIPHFYLFSPQHQYPDNIRHRHKSIENVRHSPHKLHAPHRSNAPTSYSHDPIDLRGKRYLQALSPMKNHPATVANAKSISEPDMKYFPAPPRAAL